MILWELIRSWNIYANAVCNSEFLNSSRGHAIRIITVTEKGTIYFPTAPLFSLCMQPAYDLTYHFILRHEGFLMCEEHDPFCRRKHRGDHIPLVGMDNLCKGCSHPHFVSGMAQSSVYAA